MAFGKKQIFVILVVSIVIVASFAALVYRNSDDDPVIPGLSQPEYNDKLVNVLVGNNTIVYTYGSNPGALNYTVGSYIVGTADTGYLRKITNINRDGNVVTLTTEDAALTDVVEDGELSVNQTLLMDGNLTRAGFSLSFDEVIYSSENDLSTTEVRVYGDITIDTRLVFDITISKFKVTELQFYIENTCSYNLGFEATHSITLEKEKEIFSKKLSKITFSIGPVPVVIIPEISFSIGANLELNAQLTTSLGGTFTTRGGIQYDSSGWSPIAEFEKTSYFNPPSLDLSADATVYAVTPNMIFYIYGVIGPSFQLRPYLHLHVAPFENPWWSLDLGLQGFCGIEIKVLSKTLVSESFQLFDLNWPIASAPMKEPPSEPRNLAASGGNGQAELSWDPPSDDGGSMVTGYKIYRGTSAASTKTYVATTSNATYTNTGLAANQTYYYQISATNAIGEGAMSGEVSTKTFGLPGKPSALAAAPGNKQIALSWQAPIYTGDSPITGYKIYRGVNSGSEALLTTVGALGTYTDTSLLDGKRYFYTVSALNAVGEGSQSSEAAATTFAVPGSPLNIVLTPGDGQVLLEWQAPTSNGGTPVTNYTIYRGNSSGTEVVLVKVGVVLNYTDQPLSNNATYYYRVSASNIVGEGPLCTEVSASPSATVYTPTEPRNFAAVPGHGNVTLSWNPPSNNGGSAVTNYTVYRGTTSGSEVPLVTLGNVLIHVDASLPDGQIYYYKVSATNIAGEGIVSSEVTTMTFDLPDAPDLIATPGNLTVLLEWQPTSDGGTPVTGYEIYRGTVSGNLSHLTSVGNVTSYLDANLTNFQTYFYTVSAVNLIGEGPQAAEIQAMPSPPVHNVDTNEYFNTIQAAIDDTNTTNGHTITVMAGTYFEEVTVSKSLTLIGAGKETTIIDGNYSYSTYVVGITADWVNFTEFTVQSPYSESYGALYLDGVENCTVANNNIFNGSHGISLGSSRNNTIANNTIWDNNHGGIHLLFSSHNKIQNNSIAYNEIGLELESGSLNNVIMTNDIFNNAEGISTINSCNNNVIHHNNIINNTVQANDTCANQWDDGSEGNYWSDYAGIDGDLNGIGDVAYFILGGANQDRYPLMNPRP